MTAPDANPPIVVNPNAAADQTAVAVRDVMLVVATLPALVALIGQRDARAWVDYIAGNEFAPALGVLVTAAVIGWRQWQARRRTAQLVTLANALPDTIAKVKS